MAISERQLEDYIYQHPELLEFYRFYLPDEFHNDAKAVILGRQVVVEHGIIDLLVSCQDNYPCINIVELKTQAITAKDVGQLLRYIWDIQTLLGYTSYPPEEFIDGFNQLSVLRQEMFAHIHNDVSFLQGVLIGTDVSSNVSAACQAADIEVYLYTETGNEIELTNYCEPLIPPMHKRDRALSHKLYKVIHHNVYKQIDNYLDSELGRLFAQGSR